MSDPVDTEALREKAVDADHIAGWFRDRGNEEERVTLNACRDGLTDAAAELDRLRAIMENAPHDIDCACGTMMNVEEFFPCSCWKADAP